METRKRTVELDELRLREVAINSALAKSGKQIRVKAVEVNKNNVVRIGFKIGEKDAKAVMNYYPDALFMDCDDALVAERFAIMYEKYMEQFRSYNSKPSKEDFMDNLFPNLLGAANARWLNEEGRACREVLDMAETLFCVLAPNTFMHQGEQLLLQVSDSLLESYGIEKSEAYDIAMRNLEGLYEIKPLKTVIEEMTGMEMPEDNQKMYLVSNWGHTYGAALMLSKKVQSELLEIFGKKGVIVLPSSVHEFIAVSPDDLTVSEAKQMVLEVNATQVAPDERLTDQVYIITGTPENPVLGMYADLGLANETFLVAR